MRDIDIGKRMVEEMNLEPFLNAYPDVTGCSVEVAGKSESPDFEVLIDERPTGLELTEIRSCEDAYEYVDEVYRLASKKAKSYRSNGIFDERPVILLCYSDCFAFFDHQDEFSHAVVWDDFDSLGFSEIWLMDLSDTYFSSLDPRRPADLFGLAPEKWRGFHRIGFWDRKPYG